MRPTFPEPKEDNRGAPQFEHPPRYLRPGERWLVVRQLGGVEGAPGEKVIKLLDQLKPHAVGVIVDANNDGVRARLDAFKRRYAPLYEHADRVNAGAICGGQPRLGLRVAPDNNRPGTPLDVLLAGAMNVKPHVTEKGKQFIASLETVKPGKWSKQRSGAVLGAISQTVTPGASFAVALDASREASVTCGCEGGPLGQLRQFIQDLVSPSGAAR